MEAIFMRQYFAFVRVFYPPWSDDFTRVEKYKKLLDFVLLTSLEANGARQYFAFVRVLFLILP